MLLASLPEVWIGSPLVPLPPAIGVGVPSLVILLIIPLALGRMVAILLRLILGPLIIALVVVATPTPPPLNEKSM